MKGVKEWSFLTLGTGAEDFWQGYETFCHHSMGGMKLSRNIFMGYKTILLFIKEMFVFL